MLPLKAHFVNLEIKELLEMHFISLEFDFFEENKGNK